MNVINRIKRMFSRTEDFPNRIDGYWYCGGWYMYLADLRDAGKYNGTSLDPPDIPSPAVDRVAFNPFHTGHAHECTNGLVDGLVPCIRIGKRVGLYEQIGGKYRDTSFCDGLSWDDGFKIDLKFVRSIKKYVPVVEGLE